MTIQSHIHAASDGRGYRDVFLDGELIDRVVLADTLNGIIERVSHPMRVENGEVVTEKLYGVVEVVERKSKP